MCEQAPNLSNIDTTVSKCLRTTAQDDQADSQEIKWRPFLQYPRCRDAVSHISHRAVRQRRPKSTKRRVGESGRA
jgi:hypothetical protein